MSKSCDCTTKHQTKRIVLTGGPGAGKTAVLELVRRYFCRHVHVLPEAASILFGGGFPRKDDNLSYKKSAQRAIFFIQRELERCIEPEPSYALALCDRGTLDGLAYWPGEPDDFLASFNTSKQDQLSRYDVVLHLKTPSSNHYNHQNSLRTETAEEAAVIDAKIIAAWDGHPRRIFVPSSADFLEKARHTLSLLRAELPACCSSPA